MNRQSGSKDVIYIVILSLILSLCIALTVLLTINCIKLSDTRKYILSHSCAQNVSASADTGDSQNISAEAKRLYVLGVKDGKLAIYAADGYTVVDILDTYVYSLPLSDREAVSEGIAVYSVNELVSLIQDYTS